MYGGQNLPPGMDVLHKTDAFHLLRINLLAGRDQFECMGVAHGHGQAMGGAGTGKSAPARFGQHQG